jgi:hypothetical protein
MDASPSPYNSTNPLRAKTIPLKSLQLKDFKLGGKSLPIIQRYNLSKLNYYEVHIRLRGRALELFQRIQADKPLPRGWLNDVINRLLLDELEAWARNRGLE